MVECFGHPTMVCRGLKSAQVTGHQTTWLQATEFCLYSQTTPTSLPQVTLARPGPNCQFLSIATTLQRALLPTFRTFSWATCVAPISQRILELTGLEHQPKWIFSRFLSSTNPSSQEVVTERFFCRQMEEETGQKIVPNCHAPGSGVLQGMIQISL